MAQGIRWPQCHSDAASSLLGGDGARGRTAHGQRTGSGSDWTNHHRLWNRSAEETPHSENSECRGNLVPGLFGAEKPWQDRKSTRLNSSHQIISYAVFCLKKKDSIQNWHAVPEMLRNSKRI